LFGALHARDVVQLIVEHHIDLDGVSGDMWQQMDTERLYRRRRVAHVLPHILNRQPILQLGGCAEVW
jgi:hypothetical protein